MMGWRLRDLSCLVRQLLSLSILQRKRREQDGTQPGAFDRAGRIRARQADREVLSHDRSLVNDVKERDARLEQMILAGNVNDKAQTAEDAPCSEFRGLFLLTIGYPGVFWPYSAQRHCPPYLHC